MDASDNSFIYCHFKIEKTKLHLESFGEICLLLIFFSSQVYEMSGCFGKDLDILQHVSRHLGWPFSVLQCFASIVLPFLHLQYSHNTLKNHLSFVASYP